MLSPATVFFPISEILTIAGLVLKTILSNYTKVNNPKRAIMAIVENTPIHEDTLVLFLKLS
jgi:hypothetical protein